MLDRWRYELQLLGKKVFLTPILLIVVFVLLALLLLYLKVVPTRALLGGMEMMLTVAIGILIGNIAAHDPALELHLTLPRRYDQTAMRRIGIIFAWIILLSLLCSALLLALKLFFAPDVLKQWNHALAFFTMQLAWLAPLLWFGGVGLCSALLFKSWIGGATLIAGIFIAEIVFKDYFLAADWLRPLALFPTTLYLFSHATISQADFTMYWLSSRLEVLVTGLLLLLLGWSLLRNNESLLQGASEE